MKKIHIPLHCFLLSLLLFSCDSNEILSSFGIKKSEPTTPITEVNEDWHYDETYHWHVNSDDESIEIDKDEHVFGSWIIDKEATEFENGSKHKSCIVCEYRIDEVILKLEHTHIAGDPIVENRVEADCTHEGSYDLVVKCTGCDYEFSRESHIIPALGHDYRNYPAKEPGCEEYGWNAFHECSRCGDNNKVLINPTAHQHTSTKEENYHSPTCTENGYYNLVTYCTDCLKELNSETINIPATGHQHVSTKSRNVKPSTCVSQGSYEEVTYCEDCEAELTVKTITTPLGDHEFGDPTYEWIMNSNWNLGEYAETAFCYATRVCKHDPTHVETEKVYVQSVVTVAPGIKSDGVRTFTATFANECFETQVMEKLIPATGTPEKLSYNFFAREYIYNEDHTVEIGSKNYVCVYAKDTSITGEVVIPKVIDEQIVIAVRRNNGPSTSSEDAFGGCVNITSVEFLCYFENIGYDAFAGCTSLLSIIIPSCVKKIDYCAFYNCSSLVNIQLSYGLVSIGYMAFAGCTSLKAINIPNSVETIEQYCFQSCSSLEEIHLSEQLECINQYTFEDCESLLYMVIPDSVIKICEGAFLNCSKIGYLYLSKNLIEIEQEAFKGCSNIDRVDIPDSVTNIAAAVFSGCSKFIYATIGKGLKNMPGGMFYGCSSLSSITFSGDIESFGFCAFCNCDSLLNFTVPDSVSEIGEYCFSQCDKLETFTFGSGLKTVPYRMFKECSALTSVSFSNSIEVLGQYAFEKCTSVESLVVPDSVTTINDNCFSGCSSLTSLNLGSGIKKLGHSVFEYCKHLTQITYNGTISEWESIEKSSFGAYSVIGVVHCTDGDVEYEVYY